jgi:hypothetical protein
MRQTACATKKRSVIRRSVTSFPHAEFLYERIYLKLWIIEMAHWVGKNAGAKALRFSALQATSSEVPNLVHSRRLSLPLL